METNARGVLEHGPIRINIWIVIARSRDHNDNLLIHYCKVGLLFNTGICLMFRFISYNTFIRRLSMTCRYHHTEDCYIQCKSPYPEHCYLYLEVLRHRKDGLALVPNDIAMAIVDQTVDANIRTVVLQALGLVQSDRSNFTSKPERTGPMK